MAKGPRGFVTASDVAMGETFEILNQAVQLPLPLRLEEHASFETFVAEENAPIVAHVRAAAAGRDDLLWLAGDPGTGKSHLLQAACRAAGLAGLRAMYLRLTMEMSPEVLVGLETVEVLALDGIDSVAGHARWEALLFPLVNHFYRGRGSLIFAASNPPSRVAFTLRDLASRAAGAVVYKLAPLTDAGQLAALKCHARSRGLELDEASAAYLMRRIARDMPTFCAWLDRFDRASMAAQRKITVPFIRAVLESESSDGGSER